MTSWRLSPRDKRTDAHFTLLDAQREGRNGGDLITRGYA